MLVPSSRPKAHARIAQLAGEQDWPQALSFARAVLRKWPDEAAALELAAMAASHLGQAAEAARHYQRLYALHPEAHGLLMPLGRALADAGKLAEAIKVFRQRLHYAPDDLAALVGLGQVLAMSDLAQDSAEIWREVLRRAPELPEAWSGLGIVSEQLGDFEQAESALMRALALNAGLIGAASRLSSVLLHKKDYASALHWALHALEREPDFAEARLHAGVALFELEQWPQAEACLRPLAAAQDSPLALAAAFNLGSICAVCQREEEAEAWLSEVIERAPAHAVAKMSRGMMRLTRGRLAEGWADFEARLAAEAGQFRTSHSASLPLWQGEDLAGARLLVATEQGYGDLLQFGRFVARLRALSCARIGLLCRPPLARLMATLDGPDELVVDEANNPTGDWDYYLPVMSLPHRLGLHRLEDLQRPPYLHADPTAAAIWRSRWAGRAVGLVWRGDAAHRNDRARSMAGPAEFSPLAALTSVRWVNLQKDATAPETAAFAAMFRDSLNPAAELSDFADTAALVSALDLVITVDTAVAHLAGALGRPAWVLLPWIGCDWRWLRDRADSPWYDSVRLYRQPREGDWASVIAAVKRDLAALG